MGVIISLFSAFVIKMGHLLGQVGNLLDLLVNVQAIRLVNAEHIIANISSHLANFFTISPHLLNTNSEAVQLHMFIVLKEVFGLEYWFP